jgi:putative oxidoreductase
MRLTWGYQFFISGWGKLHSIDKVSAFFSSLNIHFPIFNAYLVGTCEMVGGLLLIIGLGSRLVAIPLMIIMFMALATAHADQISGFRFLLEPTTLVAQSPYPFLITCLMVFIFGPGRVSVDAWIKRRLIK